MWFKQYKDFDIYFEMIMTQFFEGIVYKYTNSDKNINIEIF